MNEISNTEGNNSSDTLRSAPTHAPNQQDGTWSLVTYTVLALGLALFVRFFIASPYIVLGESMIPNFQNFDYLITDRISYRLEEPERGDIVVFHLPQEYTRVLIKRIVALPGDTVTATADGVRIVNAENPEGFVLDEPYLTAENIGGPNGKSVTLAENEYYVLGDNRRVSSDSRTWGVLPRDHIIGRVLLRLFPLTSIGVHPAEARYEE